jgi:hypothetical protein
MMSPPSLPKIVKDRAFRAHNGELGVLLADTRVFLDACRSDRVRVLGWELWVVNHRWDSETNRPVPEPGSWGGGIPVVDHEGPAVIGGDGDVDETGRQIASIDFKKEVRSDWLSHVRVNFALDD